MKNTLKENLEYGDLKRLVSPFIGIDVYKSKMGDDADVIVVSFIVEEKAPAKDLMTFIERGYPWVLDSDVSSGETDDRKWIVFVEIDRSKLFPEQIVQLVKEVSNLTDFDDWEFSYRKENRRFPVTEEMIREYVPLSPTAYVTKYPRQDIVGLTEAAGITLSKKRDHKPSWIKELQNAAGNLR